MCRLSDAASAWGCKERCRVINVQLCRVLATGYFHRRV
jgi:hypothetical protein